MTGCLLFVSAVVGGGGVEGGAEREAVGRSEAGARRLGVEGEPGASGVPAGGCRRAVGALEPVQKVLTPRVLVTCPSHGSPTREPRQRHRATTGAADYVEKNWPHLGLSRSSVCL